MRRSNSLRIRHYLLLKRGNFKKLFDTDVHIADWGRKFAESELIKIEERLISRLFIPAAERYRELITSMSGLLQRVRLGHIASHLSITQVSLSHIRTQIK